MKLEAIERPFEKSDRPIEDCIVLGDWIGLVMPFMWRPGF